MEHQIEMLPKLWSADQLHALGRDWADSAICSMSSRTGPPVTQSFFVGHGISPSDVVEAYKVLLALHSVAMPRFGSDDQKHESWQ